MDEKIDCPLFHSGKVRDIYDLGDEFLIVSSDRISAFDHILPSEIAGKGKILNMLSAFWFDFVKDIMPNHIISADFENFPQKLKKYEYLRARSMIVKKAKRVDIECIVRGYLSGSGWKEYQNSQDICSISLPNNLKESSKLPQPIFTPSTKEEEGKHDENISYEKMADIVGQETAKQLKDYSIALYNKAASYALSKGIILADTKFEFGFYNGELILIDEIFTPDSSRFWELSKYKEGMPQDSLDKQFVRDYLESVKWDKVSCPPKLPQEVIDKTIKKYISAYETLTERKFNV
ncbi:MAG: phosphoribosylaminoimidazolesuccinocarboxamide synthase [Elusimicrobiota bacterium]|jgi:phosphoribosylaminoimidazole-succinocarboxamide synthase|nr:phosphoribosylaminoimidazolesuccinocarboxamide synthase [Elusimicrobiota bacterium]